MGGHMTLQSEEGKGSHFTFTIRVQLLGYMCDDHDVDERTHYNLLSTWAGDAGSSSLNKKASVISESTPTLHSSPPPQCLHDSINYLAPRPLQSGQESRKPTYWSRRHSMGGVPGGATIHHKRIENEQESKAWRILLAEDNRINQKVACKLLNQIGYTHISVLFFLIECTVLTYL